MGGRILRGRAAVLGLAIAAIAMPASGSVANGSHAVRGVPAAASRSGVASLSVLAALPAPAGAPPDDHAPLPGPDADRGLPPMASQQSNVPLSPDQTGAGAPGPPRLASSFQGVTDSGIRVPDTYGAVGPENLVTSVNGRFHVQTRSGEVLLSMALDQFWSPLNVIRPFDPRVIYDRVNDRWVAIAAAESRSADSALLVAASATTDPTGTWFMYAFDADLQDQVWLDYPSIGHDADSVAVSGNLFAIGASFSRIQIHELSKTDLYDGGALSALRFEDRDHFTLVPATTEDPGVTDQYFVEVWRGSPSGYLAVFRIILNRLVPVGLASAGAWEGNGSDAPQFGSDVRLDTGDHRIHGVVLRNGALWAVHTVFAAGRGVLQWWQISLQGTTMQRGRLEDPIYEYAYPSLAVNAAGDVLIGYARFSSRTFGGAGYTFRFATDPPGTTRGDTPLKAGETAHVRDPGASNRWGDYSSTVVDPVSGRDFWTLQEYAWKPGGMWATWWGRVEPVPSAAVTLEPPALVYGAQSAGTTGTPQAVQIHNSGDAALPIGEASVGGEAGSDFSIVSNGCAGRTLAVGEHCSLEVTFAPAGEAARRAALTVQAGDQTYSGTLFGWGYVSVPGIALPAGLEFGLRGVGRRSWPSEILVGSVGDAPLTVSSVAPAGADALDFIVTADGCTGATVDPGAFCPIEIAFEPTAPGDRNGELVILSNAPGGSHAVSLHGVGSGDAVPPVTSFTTGDGDLILYPFQPVSGSVTDNDSGVVSVTVLFTDNSGATSEGLVYLACDETRRSCSFEAHPRYPGEYVVRAVAEDVVGNKESPGPTIRVTAV